MSTYGVGVIRNGRFPRPGLEGELAFLQALDQRGVFDLLDKFADADWYSAELDTTYEHSQNTMLVDSQARRLGRAVAARLRVVANDGNTEALAASLRISLAWQHAAQQQLTWEDRTMGGSIAYSALNEVRTLAAENRLSSDQCERLQDIIEQRRPTVPIESAILHWYDEALLGRLNKRLAVKEVDEREANGVLTRLKRDFAKPSRELFASQVELIGFQSRVFQQKSVLAILWDRHLQTQADATRITLALERYRAANDRYPNRLSDLVPALLQTVPIDSVSAEPFRYRLLSTPDQHARRYHLYSVGYDGVHNSGNTSVLHDDFALEYMERGRGFDYDFLRPRSDPPVE